MKPSIMHRARTERKDHVEAPETNMGIQPQLELRPYYLRRTLRILDGALRAWLCEHSESLVSDKGAES